MKSCQTGQVGEGFYVLGSPWNPVFLLDGERPVILEGGFACMAPLYLEHLAEVLGDKEPSFGLITHVHFDHCGSLGYFSRRFPQMRVACSALGQAILQRPNAVKLIDHLSADAENTVRGRWAEVPPGNGFLTFEVHLPLNDGDQIDGPTPITALASPGHTRDHMAFWLPERGMLFAGEALGVMDDTGYVVADLLQSAQNYLDSFEKLAALQPEVLAVGHRFVVTGRDVAAYLARSRDDAHAFIEKCGQAFEGLNHDMAAVVKRVRSWEYDPRPHPKQPEAAYMINLEARVKASLTYLGKLEN